MLATGATGFEAGSLYPAFVQLESALTLFTNDNHEDSF
jgi:hypothetical protein